VAGRSVAKRNQVPQKESLMERPWKVLTVVSLAVFMASLDLFIVNVAFPAIQADFDGASIAGLSWVLNAYAIVFAALLVPAGGLADRYGRRRVFLGGLVTFLLGSALCGIAPSEVALVAARVIQAAGAAALLPTSLAIVLTEFAPSKRAAAIGIWAAVGGIAAAAGPPLGGLLVDTSWRLVFLVNLPIGVAALIYGARLIAETRDETQTRIPDLAGTALLVVGVGALALGFVQAPSWGWGDSGTLAAFAGSIVALIAFVARCARHPAPVVDLALLRVRSYALSNVAAIAFFAAFAAWLLGSVLLLTVGWHESVLRAGLSLAPGPTMAAVFAVLAGTLAGRVGQRYLIGLGSLLFAVGCAWALWRVGPTPNYAGAFLPGIIVGGIGVGLTIPSLSSAAAASLPPARFATGSAVLTMSRQLGSVLGVALLVAVVGDPAVQGVDSFDAGWRLVLVAALLASLAGFAMGTVRPYEAPSVVTLPKVAAAEAAG
jgi:EmrB/QacA subfamily drug resistance transporter